MSVAEDWKTSNVAFYLKEEAEDEKDRSVTLTSIVGKVPKTLIKKMKELQFCNGI